MRVSNVWFQLQGAWRDPGAVQAYADLSKAETANETDAVRLHRQGRDGRTVSLQTCVRRLASLWIHQRQDARRDFLNDYIGRTIESRGLASLPVETLELIREDCSLGLAPFW